MRVRLLQPFLLYVLASDSFGRVPCILQYLVNEITTCYHKHRKKKEGTGVL